LPQRLILGRGNEKGATISWCYLNVKLIGLASYLGLLEKGSIFSRYWSKSVIRNEGQVDQVFHVTSIIYRKTQPSAGIGSLFHD
jgi:hypothetical protein